VILVDHAQFGRVDPVRLQAKVVIDTRGLLSRG
jgi:UDP-N-acetyl-D-mannosaminuronic acid dehydrogenase